MFNQLTAAEVVGAIGVTMRGAARSEGDLSEFERDQLMSAYSATRHLAVELETYPAELDRFRAAVADLLADPPGAWRAAERADLIDRLSATGDVAGLGGLMSDLLATLRGDDSEPARVLRMRLRALLRRLADREVELLADALG